jgi:hypothetical protein
MENCGNGATAYGVTTSIKKVKQFHNRPGVAQRVPGGLGSQIFMTFSTWRCWGHQSDAGVFLVLIFTRGWVNPRAMVQSEGNTSLKNPVTTPGIDPGTIWLVTHCFNHYVTPGPCYHIHRFTSKCVGLGQQNSDTNDIALSLRPSPHST